MSFVDWTRQYFNCVWVELELFLSGFSDVTTSMVFSYRVVSETGKIFVSRQFLAKFDIKFQADFGKFVFFFASVLFVVELIWNSRSKFPAKNLSVKVELFCWALTGFLFLARADDGIVVSGASVQDKPEANKRGISKSRPSFWRQTRSNNPKQALNSLCGSSRVWWKMKNCILSLALSGQVFWLPRF